LGVVCIFVVFATVVNLTAAAVIRAMGHTNFNLIILRDLIAHHTPLIDPVDILRDLMYGWWIAFLNSCRPVIEKPGLARLARYLKSFCHYGQYRCALERKPIYSILETPKPQGKNNAESTKSMTKT
jgi:hypothetical protein